jgi:hypothetical protein
MRLTARTQALRYSPVIALMLALALALATVVGERAIRRGVHHAAGAGATLADTIRLKVEPTIFQGGLVVSRSRHVIAGSVMGCAAGAGLGAGTAAIAGVVTGGLGWAALPPAAAIGCIIGGAGGFAIGYPLDTWSLTAD